LLTDSGIAARMQKVNNELTGPLTTAINALNQTEQMTSQAEIDSQRAMTSLTQLQDELTRLQHNVSRVSDVTSDTRSRAHELRVSTQHTIRRKRRTRL